MPKRKEALTYKTFDEAREMVAKALYEATYNGDEWKYLPETFEASWRKSAGRFLGRLGYKNLLKRVEQAEARAWSLEDAVREAESRAQEAEAMAEAAIERLSDHLCPEWCSWDERCPGRTPENCAKHWNGYLSEKAKEAGKHA